MWIKRHWLVGLIFFAGFGLFFLITEAFGDEPTGQPPRAAEIVSAWRCVERAVWECGPEGCAQAAVKSPLPITHLDFDAPPDRVYRRCLGEGNCYTHEVTGPSRLRVERNAEATTVALPLGYMVHRLRIAADGSYHSVRDRGGVVTIGRGFCTPEAAE